MSYPKVSIVMGVYNEESHIREAISSMLNQSFGDFEFIIINDGSTDRTEELISGFDDPRIRYIRNDANIGLTKTLNKGLRIAKGKYIARMDGNDISHPTRLEKEVKVLDSDPEIHLVWPGAIYITSTGELLCEKKSPPLKEVVDLLRSSPTELPVGRNHINHVAVMFQKNSVLNMGGYDEKYKWGQDGNLWYRMVRKGSKFFFIEEPLISIRQDIGSVTFQRRVVKLSSPAEAYCRVCMVHLAWRKAFYYLLKMPFGIKKTKLGVRMIVNFLRFLLTRKLR